MRRLAIFESHPVPFATAMAEGLFRGIVDLVHDGDSYFCLVDLGFTTYEYVEIRLADVNTAEIVGTERAQGLAAKSFVEAAIGGQPVLLKTRLDTSGGEVMSFVRYVADVWLVHQTFGTPRESVAEMIRAAGFDKLHPLVQP
jgi:hypothetical protein